MFRLKNNDYNIIIKSKEINKIEDDKEYDLEILKFPQYTKIRKVENSSLKRKLQGDSLQKATEECVKILKSKYPSYCMDALKKNLFYQNCNIYCPFHENPESSKTPSARFYVSNHNFVCFSSNCSINNLNSIQFLDLLNPTAKKKKVME